MAGGRLYTVDRVGLGALGVADLGVGLYLVGSPGNTDMHMVFAVLAWLLGFAAIAVALSGNLPPFADEGVLINAGVLTFLTLDVVWFGLGPTLSIVGVVFILVAMVAATIALYVRLFDAIRVPARGRRHVR